MSECMHFTEGEFYQRHFDSRAYVKNFYSYPRGHSDEKDFLTFVLRCLSRVFSTGKQANESGRSVRRTHRRPTECSVGGSLVAASLFSNGRDESGLTTGRRLLQDSSGAHFGGRTPFFPGGERAETYGQRNCGGAEVRVSGMYSSSQREADRELTAGELHCNAVSWYFVIIYLYRFSFIFELFSPSDLEASLKQRVKKVLKCDVRLDNTFYPHTLEPADCVITSLCLEAACKDIQTYRRALHGLTKLLRPGVLLVMVGVLGETFYKVDEQSFSCLRLSQYDIEEALRGLGLSIHEFNLLPVEDQKSNSVSTCGEKTFRLNRGI
ncbi:indolethylamine N-methyltransferase [Rhinichthys klamathensis goyatoka]|uniref:indolethylamine N-methyltransferase n=1 Tax=Rhinichthys klamathensis goyatoka TaxID=3034132 RepID=UPI0024B5F75F|nr:indolethylamine N-methyltransferase [Rhinichthys klamathensis goyatoka]